MASPRQWGSSASRTTKTMARVKSISRKYSPPCHFRVRVNTWRWQPFKKQWTPTTRGKNQLYRNVASRVELAQQLGLDVDQTKCVLVFRG